MRRDEPERLAKKTWVKEPQTPFAGWKEGEYFVEAEIEQAGWRREEELFRVRMITLKIFVPIFVLAFFFTLGIFLLQGFHFMEFNLQAEVITNLSIATIGEIVGLILALIRIQVIPEERTTFERSGNL